MSAMLTIFRLSISFFSNSNHVPPTVSVATLPLHEPEAADVDKRAIYRHPLFPLVAMLFEKCEQATSTPDCPPADSFDVDIHAFVHQQEQDGKPFFSDDPDLDNLVGHLNPLRTEVYFCTKIRMQNELVILRLY
jgi:hypothetical protein